MKSLSEILHNKQVKSHKQKNLKTVKSIRMAISNNKDLTIEELKERVQSYRNHNNIDIVNIYAYVTLAIEKIYGLKLYDVQLEGALTLNQGMIAEMKTGEGKTITSALPIILNALSGHVHVVTVNPYLARRDKEYLEKLYSSLGFTTGLNLNEMKIPEKKKAYEADITYSTASEFGFDFLRDNMVMDIDERLNPFGLNYAIIDEVDLVLIDEARTPLIIGKPKEDNQAEIIKADNVAKRLKSEDYHFDPQSKAVILTDSGQNKVEDSYNIDNLYSTENIGIMYRINQALLANISYQKDIDYALAKHSKKEPKELVIIDTFTGRLQFGRRFTNGLHQALEAKHRKEGIEIKDESVTVATITLQNYFRKYKKLSGMTGTAKEESKELNQIYGLEVVQIDTNKPLNREDFPIIILENKNEKWDYVVERIKYHHEKGRPILIGTVSVDDSETLSRLLKNKKLYHRVLNAKQDSEEAEIISKAGKLNAITVATNMAGRGTDIKVDEGTELVVFLTELNESLRIDNQLKGRTSRQGAYGITETILSVEDEVFKKSNISQLKRLTAINPLPPSLEKILRTVQRELESAGYSSRNNSLKYDDVIREQRDIFYKTRNKILETKDLKDCYEKMGGKHYNELEEFSKDTDLKNKILREILLYSLDESWVSHIDKLEKLKSGITWRSYNGSNPIIIYQNEAKELWNEFIINISNNINLLTKDVNKTGYKKFKSVYERKIG